MRASKLQPRRYAIYTRQSTDATADLSSCDAQFAVCWDVAQAAAEPGLVWCEERFDDRGHSGATLDRPALNRLRQLVLAGGIQRIYAVAMDRVSRNDRDTVALLEEFDRCGVELLLVHQPELGGPAERRLLRHILASFAEFEREMIGVR